MMKRNNNRRVADAAATTTTTTTTTTINLEDVKNSPELATKMMIQELRFKKCKCIRFILDRKIQSPHAVCQCGLNKQDHGDLHLDDADDDEMKWDCRIHTADDGPTDAYGSVRFRFSRDDDQQTTERIGSAKFVRLSHRTDVDGIIDLMFKRSNWKIKYPSIVISVTGGAQLSIQPRLVRILSKGIVNACKETNALIITGGTNNGCMKLVGNAVEGFNSLCDREEKIPLVGIADWCCIANRESLLISRKNSDNENNKSRFYNEYLIKDREAGASGVYLEPNHTHFILVDDASNKFGGEIRLRAELEKKIAACENDYNMNLSMKIPRILLVLGGGEGTIETVFKSINDKAPCIFIKSTGRACDLFVDLLEHSSSSSFSSNQDFQNQNGNKRILIDDERIHKKVSEYFPNTKAAATTLIEQIKEIMLPKNRHLLTTVVDLKNEKDVYEAIIRASLKSSADDGNQNYDIQMNLALRFNCIEIVRDELLTDELRGKFNEKQLMLNAIRENKHEFVRLFLNNHGGGQQFSLKFLTSFQLLSLYNEIILNDSALKMIYKRISQDYESKSQISFDDVANIIACSVSASSKSSSKHLHQTKHQFNKELYGNIRPETLKKILYIEKKSRLNEMESHSIRKHPRTAKANAEIEDQSKSLNQPVESPEHELFLLSIVSGRFEMARIFCMAHQYPLCSALIATKILKLYARKSLAEEDALSYAEMAASFEKLAYDLLDKSYRIDEKRAEDLLIRKIPDYSDLTCLQVAVMANDTLFISNQCVQRLLDAFWYGDIQPHTAKSLIFLSAALLPIAPFILQNKFIKSSSSDEENNKEKRGEEERQVEAKKANNHSYWKRFGSFWRTPFIQFIYHQAFYVVFLFLFSYVLLCELEPRRTNYKDGEGFQVPVAEIVLIVWVFTYFIEEIMLLIHIERDRFVEKLAIYFKGFWNILDLFSIGLFIIGMCLRFLPSGANSYAAARVILSIDIIFWYIKCLYMYTFIKTLGPKLLMILKMSTELAFFLAILVLFLFAFGVSTQSLMFQRQELSINLLKRVFFPSYFVIGGEYYTLDTILAADECSAASSSGLTSDFSSSSCPDKLGANISSIIYVFYLMFLNILLVNLLIAIFNNTYEAMQTEANKIWKFQRYDLVYDFYHKSFWPRPLNTVKYFYDLVCLPFSKDKSMVGGLKPSRILSKEENDNLLKWEKRMAINIINEGS